MSHACIEHKQRLPCGLTIDFNNDNLLDFIHLSIDSKQVHIVHGLGVYDPSASICYGDVAMFDEWVQES